MTLQIPWPGKLLPWYGTILYLTEAQYGKFKRGEYMPHFGGRTDDASAPILGARFWKPKTQLIGTVVRAFETDNGLCYTIKLNKPLSVNRNFTYPPGEKTETLDKVSVGSLKGFEMALQASGIPNGKLQFGDKIQITCTGTTPSGKGNDQIDFDVQIDRKSESDDTF